MIILRVIMKILQLFYMFGFMMQLNIGCEVYCHPCNVFVILKQAYN